MPAKGKHLPMESEEQVEGLSRAEQLMASRLRSSQFRLTTVFGMMALAGVLMAIPRFAGFSYRWYFNFLYILSYACTPLLAWLVYALLPRRFGVWRAVACGLVAVGLAVPFWGLVVWHDGTRDALLVIALTCLFLWLPQILCLWSVWFFVFRSTSPRR
jgi:hypothetical protein